MDENQEIKLPQEGSPVQVVPPAKKSKKMKRIIVAATLLLMVIVIGLCVCGQSNNGKDIYELFPRGAKKEAVLRKLDKLNIYYYDNNYKDILDEDVNMIVFSCFGVQGSTKNGEVSLDFGKSGKQLQSISVKVTMENSDELWDYDTDRQLGIIMSALTSKYGEMKDSDPNKAKCVWESKPWRVTLINIHNVDPEINMGSLRDGSIYLTFGKVE